MSDKEAGMFKKEVLGILMSIADDIKKGNTISMGCVKMTKSTIISASYTDSWLSSLDEIDTYTGCCFNSNISINLFYSAGMR